MKSFLLLLLILSYQFGFAQNIIGHIPKKIDTSKKYVFYLHGAIVQQQGPNAVSDLFGPYEYQKILNTLASYGYEVISEVRAKGTEVEDYARKVSKQIDTLLQSGLSAKNIIVVGASLGAYMTIETAHLKLNKQIRYVVLGLCSDYVLGYFEKYNEELCGDFLSIYEKSDNKLSCNILLASKNCKTGYQEIELNMGNGHGFLYKPYPEWIDPLVEWINKK